MKTCLIVEDSSIVRKIARRIVEGLGFEVVEAEDGVDALVVCKRAMPEAILLDWNMPVMDGYTFITEVRANPDWRNVTLMMVTTESEQGQIVRALAAGAHEYVIKPFTPDAIAEKLELLGLTSGGAA